MKRALDAIRRWWRSGGKGSHAKPRYVGRTEFIDVTAAIIPRMPTMGQPPWEICAMPIADPPALHPIVMKKLGASSVAAYIAEHFPMVPA